MSKPLVAIDIDDVLAGSIESFIGFVHQNHDVKIDISSYGAKGEYFDYHERVLKNYDLDGDGIVDDFYKKLETDQADVSPIQDAVKALNKLSDRYNFVAISSRYAVHQAETAKWVAQNFGELFENVHCIDTFNSKETKGSYCLKVGAKYLIDDHIGHCRSALEKGIIPILFGVYGWNQEDNLIPEIQRCNSWGEVETFFNGRL